MTHPCRRIEAVGAGLRAATDGPVNLRAPARFALEVLVAFVESLSPLTGLERAAALVEVFDPAGDEFEGRYDPSELVAGDGGAVGAPLVIHGPAFPAAMASMSARRNLGCAPGRR